MSFIDGSHDKKNVGDANNLTVQKNCLLNEIDVRQLKPKFCPNTAPLTHAIEIVVTDVLMCRYIHKMCLSWLVKNPDNIFLKIQNT